MPRRVAAIPGIVIGILAASVQATEYYVDGTASGTGAGTAANPWRQISSAVSSLLPGDIVHVSAGTYNPFEIINRSGQPGNPISFLVDAGEMATINGGVAGVNRDGIRIRDSSHLILDGFRLVGTGDPSTSRAGISVQSSALGSRLGNSAVSGNHQDVILRNNTISNYGTWGIFTAYVNGLLIEGNSLSGSIEEHGLYISNASKDQIVRKNVVFNNNGSGIQLNGDFAFGGGGIISNALVESNIVFGNGVGGGGALNNEGVQGSVFRNNVLYNNLASGIVLWIGENGAPAGNSSNNNVVVNNTVYQPANGRAALQIDRGYNNTIFNNVLFHANGTFRDAVGITTVDTNTESDFNIFSANFELADNDINLATWRAQTGGDLNSTVLTLAQLQALFLNFGANDFRLSPTGGAAAIDDGIASFNGWLAPNVDFANGSRPANGLFDIGAYEYAAIPEPSSLALLLVGVFGLRRRTAKSNRQP
jgi:hypothetical protein